MEEAMEEEQGMTPAGSETPSSEDKAAARQAFEAKRAARLERLQARAAAKRAEGERALKAERAILGAIPLGQPILVGHHSEKRHRRDLKRADGLCRRGMEALREAEEAERRLASAEDNHAVSSDDPDAVEKLKAKARLLEEERDQAKQVNAALRAASRRADKAGLATEHEQRTAYLAEALRSVGIRTERAINALLTPDYAGRIGVPGYRLQNLGQEIARVRARVEALQAQQAAAPREPEHHGDVRIVEEDNRVRILFAGKPDETVRARLKSRGFRWSPTAGAWQRHASPAAWCAAREVVAWSKAAMKRVEQDDFVEVLAAPDEALLGRRLRVSCVVNRGRGDIVCADEHGNSYDLKAAYVRVLGAKESVP
jgi:hypothetical protein